MRELHRGRNVVVGVRCGDGAAYVVKLTSPEAAARERWWYRQVLAAPAHGTAAPSRWLDVPLVPGTLLFAVDPQALDARAYAVARQDLPAGVPVAIARQLAALHAHARGDGPPALRVPPAAWRTDFADPLLRRCARRAVCAHAPGWSAQAVTALVHADVRWENIVLAGDGGAAVLIDWEDAGRGAPAWDVGCLLAAYDGYLARAEVQAGGAPAAALRRIVAAHCAAAWQAYRADAPAISAAAGFARAVLAASAIRLAESALAPSDTALQPRERAALLAAAEALHADPARVAAERYGIRDSLE